MPNHLDLCMISKGTPPARIKENHWQAGSNILRLHKMRRCETENEKSGAGFYPVDTGMVSI